jgi:2,4-dienoyl-CoA reductase-like NADH-dependent reductase (Old Yellow Enzyme family)
VLFRFSQWKSGAYDQKIAQTPSELESILAPLAEAGVDVFHASTRRYWLPEFDDSTLNLAGWAKKLTNRPTITVGSVGLDTEFTGPTDRPGKAATEGLDNLFGRLERDEFDLVAVGRALIADPSWANSLLSGNPKEIRYSSELLATLR